MEKRNEMFLGNLLEEAGFPNEKIFLSPSENNDLKYIFRNASKSTEMGRGIPDRIIYDGKTLIIFEVKPRSLSDAVSDLSIYHEKISIQDNDQFDIFYVAFVNAKEYKIFNKRFKEIDLLIKPENFNMHRSKSEICITKELGKIHQYMYDNMKISADDRAFFISLILIGIKSECFRNKVKKLSTTDNHGLYLELKNILDAYEIQASCFEFLKNDSNSKYFYWVTSRCLELYDNAKDNFDLMSRFYNEFLKYNNDSLKSIGCVITPNHCSEIMAELLQLQPDDIVLDICAGTGSLIYECHLKSPKQIIVCEQQTKLLTLLQCQKILLDNNMEIHGGDCFQKTFRATKSIINPPYSKNKEAELMFCFKQLESIDNGGLAVALVQIGKINGPSKHRSKLFKSAKIKCIIIMNENLFKPYASAHSAILLMEKLEGGHNEDNDYVKIVNFRDDGYESKRPHGRINVNFEDRKKELYHQLRTQKGVQITENGFWLNDYLEFDSKDADPISIILQRDFERRFEQKKESIKGQIESILKSGQQMEFKLLDLFQIIHKPTLECKDMVPVVSAKKHDNGISGYKVADDGLVYKQGNFVFIMQGQGGAGIVHYLREPFLVTNSTKVLQPLFELDDITNEYIAGELSGRFKKKYSRSNNWSGSKMKNDTVQFPCTKEGKLCSETFEKIRNVFVSHQVNAFEKKY